ncbi:hypothetical protein GGI1_09473 [Acidithiobacillus sp. GGI-221]|nr:hypothetical protein GGI1_09473 [Acidithiobacillus sp. GGI-221]
MAPLVPCCWPRPSGAETRQELRRAVDKGRDRLRNMESVAEERIGVLIDEIQEKTAHLMDVGGDLVESKRQDLLEAIQVAKRALAEERGYPDPGQPGAPCRDAGHRPLRTPVGALRLFMV